MSAWLDPLRAVLDHRDAPITYFFRDDDAGWDDERLFALLDCFAEFHLPIDLAVIPIELRDDLAKTLLKRKSESPMLLGLHQHGYSHTNHETTGRKCEFGPSRSAAHQGHDIKHGAKLLREKLGSALDSIFTPPWNRCSTATATALRRHGFRALSRDITAAPLELGDLVELPVCVDWSKRKNGVAISREALGVTLAAAIDAPSIGVMLHHAVMESADLLALRQFLELLDRYRNVNCLPMRALVETTAQVI